MPFPHWSLLRADSARAMPPRHALMWRWVGWAALAYLLSMVVRLVWFPQYGLSSVNPWVSLMTSAVVVVVLVLPWYRVERVRRWPQVMPAVLCAVGLGLPLLSLSQAGALVLWVMPFSAMVLGFAWVGVGPAHPRHGFAYSGAQGAMALAGLVFMWLAWGLGLHAMGPDTPQAHLLYRGVFYEFMIGAVAWAVVGEWSCRHPRQPLPHATLAWGLMGLFLLITVVHNIALPWLNAHSDVQVQAKSAQGMIMAAAVVAAGGVRRLRRLTPAFTVLAIAAYAWLGTRQSPLTTLPLLGVWGLMGLLWPHGQGRWPALGWALTLLLAGSAPELPTYAFVMHALAGTGTWAIARLWVRHLALESTQGEAALNLPSVEPMASSPVLAHALPDKDRQQALAWAAGTAATVGVLMGLGTWWWGGPLVGSTASNDGHSQLQAWALAVVLTGYGAYAVSILMSQRRRVDAQATALAQAQELLSASVVSMWIFNAQGELVWANPAARQAFGSQVDGAPLLWSWPLAERATLRHQLTSVLQSGGHFRAPYQGPLLGQAEVAGTLVCSRQVLGDQPRLLIQFVDESAVRTSEAKLRDSMAELDLYWNHTDDGVHIEDEHGRVIRANPAFAHMLGRDVASVIGLSPHDWLVGDVNVEIVDVWRPDFSSVRKRAVYRRADGTTFDADVTLTKVKLGAHQYLYGLVRDITERVAAERAMEEARALAESASVAKTRFLSNLSHEMRTPLNALLGYSQLLSTAQLTRAERDQLTKMQVAGQHLLGLINDVLDFSKIEAGEFALMNEPLKLQDVLDSVGDLLSGQAQARGLTLRIQPLPPTLPVHVMGDAQRLRQMLINLVGNAIKFTPEGWVELRVLALASPHRQQQRLAFEVQDTGVGISEADQHKLFRRFSQVDNSSTRQHAGTGLGLAIVKEMATRMGGQVRVLSQPGQGSTFTAEVVLAVAQSAPSTVDHSPLSVVASPGQPLAGMRVLVVDDSDMNLDVAKQLLTRQGAEVHLAHDGADAVAWLQQPQHDVDAVLMDLYMPIMGGLDATRWIRQDPRCQALPVVAMSAGATQTDRDAAREAGMNDYVLKPFDPEHLYGVLARLRRSGGAEAPSVSRAVSNVVPLRVDDGPADAWPVIEGIDGQLARARMGHNLDLFKRQLNRLRDEFGGWVSAPPWAEVSGEGGSVSGDVLSALHKFKGNAGLVGATGLHQAAARAESLIKSQAPAEAVRDALHALQSAWQSLLHGLAMTQATAEPLNPRPADVGVASVWDADDLHAFKEALASGSFTATRMYAQLQPCLMERLGSDRAAELQLAMNGLNFEAALAFLNEVETP